MSTYLKTVLQDTNNMLYDLMCALLTSPPSAPAPTFPHCCAAWSESSIPVGSSRVGARLHGGRLLQEHLQPPAEAGGAVLRAGAAAGQPALWPCCPHQLHAGQQVRRSIWLCSFISVLERICYSLPDPYTLDLGEESLPTFCFFHCSVLFYFVSRAYARTHIRMHAHPHPPPLLFGQVIRSVRAQHTTVRVVWLLCALTHYLFSAALHPAAFGQCLCQCTANSPKLYARGCNFRE